MSESQRLSRRIAIATSKEWIHLAESDRILADALRQRGHEVFAHVWSSGIPANADAVVIRSCWDYHLHLDQFLAWTEAVPVPVINSPATVRWNARKTYLLDLAAAGIPVVPTRHIVDGELNASVFEELAARRLVIKPVVGASSFGTRVVEVQEPQRVKEVLVQPYVEEIVSGEWSLVVFDGVFSHSVLKRPRDGDFRVQAELGGRIAETSAPPELRALAERVVQLVQPSPAHARVDVVVTADGPLLMELELIEPELFLNLVPDSAPLFCAAIERRLA